MSGKQLGRRRQIDLTFDHHVLERAAARAGLVGGTVKDGGIVFGRSLTAEEVKSLNDAVEKEAAVVLRRRRRQNVKVRIERQVQQQAEVTATELARLARRRELRHGFVVAALILLFAVLVVAGIMWAR